jgi:catechol 2,3-dioxygenase-like lactoylglutathione lyase family enzyme
VALNWHFTAEAFLKRSLVVALFFFLSGYLVHQSSGTPPVAKSGDAPMRLGNFSVSLAVKDIAKSREFYEKLGFHVWGGDQAKNWLIMQNDTATIGLFQGVFEKNTLTFNPGWDRTANAVASFDDVREIQKALESRGIVLATKVDGSTTGPGSLMVMDPDGNPILVDQHVPSPGK